MARPRREISLPGNNCRSVLAKSDFKYFFGSAVAIDGGNVLIGVKDSEMRIHSSSDSYTRIEEAGVAVMFESPRNVSSNKFYYEQNLQMYVALYVMIIIGIAVLLVAPVVIFGYHMYSEDKDATKMLEMKPFIKPSSQGSSSSHGMKNNPIGRMQS